MNQKLKIAVVGSRSLTDKKIVFDVLDKNKDKIDYIISGGAEGIDNLASLYCQEKGLSIKIYYPKWYNDDGTFFKGAGFVRNKLIAEEADYIICFWDKISRGCMNTVEWAKKLEKPYKIIECDNPLDAYYIFAASSSLFSPYNICKFTDKSKGLDFESVYHGYCWYFAKFIDNENLQKELFGGKNYIKTFEKLISQNLIGDKWPEWEKLEPRILKYLYKIKSFSCDLKDELIETKDKKIIYANVDDRLGCGLKKNEITIDKLGDGLNLVGGALEELRKDFSK